MTIFDRIIARVTRRPPDFVIGGDQLPYLRRWWILPRNRFLNLYLHHFCRSDDDRALHDHPWAWCSILLRGGYTEHTIAAGGIHRRHVRTAPSIKFAGGSRAHRVELFDSHLGTTMFGELPCWTLFITGPRYREWGFHCPEQGWVHWTKFTSADGRGVGKGCEQ